MHKVLFIKCMLPAIFLNYTITVNAQDHKEQHLSARQRSIVSISGLTAIGDLEKLKAQFNTGLDSGLTISEIKEVLVQLYAYCGFPRSLNGINTLMTARRPRPFRIVINIKPGKRPCRFLPAGRKRLPPVPTPLLQSSTLF